MALISASDLLQTLQTNITKIPGWNRKNPMPFAILDIDGTILDPFPRHLAVYETILQPQFDLPPIHELDIRSKPYFLGDLIPKLKDDTSTYQQAVEVFLEHFLSPEFLHLDQPYPGAISFLTEIRKMGVGILYLTSRHLYGPRSMVDKTIETMGDLGFPIGPSMEVLFAFKPNIEDDDFEFKRKFAQKFRANKFQSCIFFVDNEMKTCQIFQEEFPQCYVARFDSAQSQDFPFSGPTLTSWEMGKAI